MQFLDLLKMLSPEFDPNKSKIHLASHNGYQNPLDVYKIGEFDSWQMWQTKRNFQRDYVISLIAMHASNWLFAGIHKSNKSPESKVPEWEKGLHSTLWHYDLVEDPSFIELNGRLVVEFNRKGRQSYLDAETWIDQIKLREIYPKKLEIETFPGYKSVNISKSMLDAIIGNSVESWKAALQSVAGVYLIADNETGKFYVGSATGNGGIWQRWSEYSKSGHGGNVELKGLLKDADANRANHFHYSVLEIADTHTSAEAVLERESYWKRVLLTRVHGLNS